MTIGQFIQQHNKTLMVTGGLLASVALGCGAYYGYRHYQRRVSENDSNSSTHDVNLPSTQPSARTDNLGCSCPTGCQTQSSGNLDVEETVDNTNNVENSVDEPSTPSVENEQSVPDAEDLDASLPNVPATTPVAQSNEE